MLLKLASARQKAFDIEMRRGLADGPADGPRSCGGAHEAVQRRWTNLVKLVGFALGKPGISGSREPGSCEPGSSVSSIS